ncbi:hypothetical protein LINPERHAP2_LOCUS30739 [Linum perenne]
MGLGFVREGGDYGRGGLQNRWVFGFGASGEVDDYKTVGVVILTRCISRRLGR